MYTASGITSIDLTGLATGSDASHTHIYEKKYNTTKHWEECWICGAKRNESNHHLTTTDYSWGYQTCYPGNTYTKYCTDGCGYSFTTKDACVDNNNYVNEELRYLHHSNCQNCGVWMNDTGCTDKNGNRLNCKNLGTCVICGYTYTQPIHHITNEGKCEFCGVQFVELVDSSVTYASDNSYAILRWRLKGINGGALTGDMSWYSPNPATSKEKTIIKNSTNDYTYEYKITFSNSVQNVITASIDTNTDLTVNGYEVHFSGWKLSAYYDHIAPTANLITVSGNGTVNNYSQKATVTAKVKETFSDYVEMRLLDSDKKTVLVDWGTATETSDIFTRTMDVVAEMQASKTLYVESRDRMGNVCTQSINVQYIDAKAPTLVSQSGNTTTWAKSKNITYTVNDGGIGGASIAFNNQSDFQVATQSGNNYSRTYNFYGDVYGSVTGALYIKDALGNIRTEKVTISKLDGTAPTITGTSIKNNVITVTAHD